MSKHYILEGKEPKEAWLMEWAVWFETANRHLASDHLKNKKWEDIHISTVFLGLDHSFWEWEPLLFETMIFGWKHDSYQERYSTYDEALEWHEKAKILSIN